MAEYHVGCGLAGIYAGTFRKNKTDEWLDKNDVTKEAIQAVATYMDSQIPKDSDSFAYILKRKNGEYVRLSVESLNGCSVCVEEVHL